MNIKRVVFAAAVFVILYNIFFFHTQFGIGTGLLFLAINAYFFSVKANVNKNLSYGIASSAVSVIFAFLISFRDNEIVQLINFTTAVFFSLTSLFFYKYSADLSYQVSHFLLLPFVVVKNAFKGFLGILSQDNLSSKHVEKDIISSLVRGLIIAVPIFGILLFLLLKADPIFNKLAQTTLTGIGERTITSLIIFAVLLGFGLEKFREKMFVQKENNKIAAGKSHELAIIIGSVITLFALFIVVQFRYLFSTVGERELSQLGITTLTYSDYVRRGFFELLIAAGIASFVIIHVLKYVHHLRGGQKLLIQAFSGILTVETGLLLLSAAKRVALYADAHGLTRARVFGFVFLIWLSILLIIFLIRIYKDGKKELIITANIVMTLVIFILINIVNIDGLIATKYKPTVNNEVDYNYITNLSTDAYASWKPAIADADSIVSQLEKKDKLSAEDNRKIYWARLSLDNINSSIGYLISKYGTVKEILEWRKDKYHWVDWVEEMRKGNGEKFPKNVAETRTWQAYNASEYNAYKMVSGNMSYFQQIFVLQDRMNVLTNRKNSAPQSVPLDRSTKSPLTL